MDDDTFDFTESEPDLDRQMRVTTPLCVRDCIEAWKAVLAEPDPAVKRMLTQQLAQRLMGRER